MIVTESFSAGDTFALGKRVGEQAGPGQIYLLEGDLGVGKTVFTQGFAKGLGIDENVNSPTFTILQVYESGRLPFYHFDVYRIEDPDEMDEIGADEYFFGSGVCMIEWAEKIAEILPKGCTRVRIEKNLELGFDYRRIQIMKEEP